MITTLQLPFAVRLWLVMVATWNDFFDRIRRHWAITTAICTSFKVEILKAVHDFTASTGDTFKLALYTSSATMDATTTAYSATNEVGASGTYSAGGGALTSATPVSSGTTAICDFADLAFTSATITARGSLIYNSTKSNKAVIVNDFGADKTSTAGTFTIVFPTPDASNAIIRIA
jgi:hypothetical protein